MKDIKICQYTIKMEHFYYVVYEESTTQKIGDNFIQYRLDEFEKLSDAIDYINTFIKRTELNG